MKKMDIVRSLSLLFALWISVTDAEMRGVEEGKKTFDEKRCMVCHSLGGTGGEQAKWAVPWMMLETNETPPGSQPS